MSVDMYHGAVASYWRIMAIAQRHAYVEWLTRRLESAEFFEEEADRASALRV